MSKYNVKNYLLRNKIYHYYIDEITELLFKLNREAIFFPFFNKNSYVFIESFYY
jgi:hypothetical protein